jgi:hypothetical protein
MRARIRFLEDELQRKDAILMNMTEAMKALSPPVQEEPPEPRQSPETVESPGPRERPFTDEERAQEAAQPRSWWRRMFG